MNKIGKEQINFGFFSKKLKKESGFISKGACLATNSLKCCKVYTGMSAGNDRHNITKLRIYNGSRNHLEIINIFFIG